MRLLKYMSSFINKPEPILQFYVDNNFTRRSDGSFLKNERTTVLLRENRFGFRDTKVFQENLSETHDIAKAFKAGIYMWENSTQKACDIPWGEFFKGCTMQILHQSRYGKKIAITVEKETPKKEKELTTYKF